MRRLQLVVRCALAGVLVFAAASKLASPRSSRAALATFGLRGRASWPAWAAIIATELGLAAGVALGSTAAAFVAAGLLLAFAGALALALRRGRAGAPCACFGSRSRVSLRGVGRNAALALAFAALPFLPAGSLTTEGWLALGIAVALTAVAALTVAVVALAREVGMLRLQLGPQAALEVAGEGPPIGERTPLIERFDAGPRARLALAVFSSEGCHLCRSLEPAVEAVGRDPLVALRVFDDVRDADVWAELRVPGSPYAVALDLDGTVRAKGTFNSFAQLETVLAAAERRTREAAHA
jgi:methylamine utilization protein MauE